MQNIGNVQTPINGQKYPIEPRTEIVTLYHAMDKSFVGQNFGEKYKRCGMNYYSLTHTAHISSPFYDQLFIIQWKFELTAYLGNNGKARYQSCFFYVNTAMVQHIDYIIGFLVDLCHPDSCAHIMVVFADIRGDKL